MIRFLTFIATVALLWGCSHPLHHDDNINSVNHVVLIWLKEPGNTQHRQQIVQASKALEKIPGVAKVRTGEVIASERNIVDDSFDVGVYMLFKNERAMKSYTSHPEHIEIVKTRVAPLADKIVVYDFGAH